MNFAAIIQGFFKSMSLDTQRQIKSSVNKLDEFLPIIDTFHETIPKRDGENEIGYLIRINNGKVILYQVGILANEKTTKLECRGIEKWDIKAEINELTEGI